MALIAAMRSGLYVAASSPRGKPSPTFNSRILHMIRVSSTLLREKKFIKITQSIKTHKWRQMLAQLRCAGLICHLVLKLNIMKFLFKI